MTLLALVGFAANSLLCRLALAGEPSIDPLSFTAIRIVSGAVVLAALARGRALVHGDARSAALLLAYAIPFSLAYLRVAGGVGALLLFAAVQITMFGVALARGERPGLRTYAGVGIAALGVIVLVAPGLEAPDPIGAALMVVAGAAWGGYSLRGRAANDALGATAGNFVRAAPVALLATLLGLLVAPLHATPVGVALAVTSGSLASGLGYALWYSVVPTLGATRAAVVQLAAPVLATLGAVVVLDEPLSARVLVAASLVVAGVASAVTAPKG